LTSRRQSFEISATLKQLERSFVGVKKGEPPVDVLLASNMLSVGVDIERLGLMVMSAQPKTTAEYIQASSRIGRHHPGLVVQVYNWVRPRDISHYERFENYHQSFYRYVESTSVTPFSERARDRALPGVLAGYFRHAGDGAAMAAGANVFDPDDDVVVQFINRTSERAESVTHRTDVGEETKIQLSNLADQWRNWVADPAPLFYSIRGRQLSDRILLREMENEGKRGHWPVAGSLREVEEEVDIVLLDD